MKTTAESILLLLMGLMSTTKGHAQSSWTIPVRIDPSTTLQQDYQVIAVGPQRQIAVACREGNITGRMAVYRSTNNGATFLRTQIATPPVPEFEIRRTEALAFNVDGDLYLLWSWNETPGGILVRQWLVISKSTDGGQSFTNIWSNAQPSFNLVKHKMLITPDRTIHVVRDSIVPPPERAKEIYTRFINGDPANKIEVVLPPPGDTVYSRLEADILIAQSALHYACYGYTTSVSQLKLFYSRSTDNGNTFPAMVVSDSALPQFGRAANGNTVLFGRALENDSYLRLAATKVCDSTIGFSPRFILGTKWLASDGTIRMHRLLSQNHLVYGGIDTQSVTSYYQYDDLQSSPTDSAFFPLLKHPDFAVDSLGGKYIVADHQREFRLYFTKKDVVTGIDNGRLLPSTTILYQNYPNPFNPATAIEYSIGVSGTNMQRVRLRVYDILGRQVASLVDELKQPGRYRATWEAGGLSSGVYFGRLEVNERMVAVKKLILLR